MDIAMFVAAGLAFSAGLTGVVALVKRALVGQTETPVVDPLESLAGDSIEAFMVDPLEIQVSESFEDFIEAPTVDELRTLAIDTLTTLATKKEV
jgi:hypothetical protein